MTYEFTQIVLPTAGLEQPSFVDDIDRSCIWGTFFGLFGIPNNQRIIVSRMTDRSLRDAIPDSAIVNHFTMAATARPVDTQPLSRDGLYVNRTFNILPDHVDEFVELSKVAWQTFETDDEFAAHPFGLFRPDQVIDGLVPMQLFTWYDNLASWERSRNPDEAASENFSRRRLLTVTSSAIATRLVTL